MIYRILKFGLLASIIQIILYMIAIAILQNLESIFSSNIILRDRLLNVVWVLFMINVFVQNVLVAIVNNKKFTYIIFAVSVVILSIPWLYEFKLFPCLPILFINIAVIAGKLLIDIPILNKIKYIRARSKKPIA